MNRSRNISARLPLPVRNERGEGSSEKDGPLLPRYLFSPFQLRGRGSPDFSEEALRALGPGGTRENSRGQARPRRAQPPDRKPRMGQRPGRAPEKARRCGICSGRGFAPFFPRPSRAQNPSARPSGGCARRLACPRLLSVVPPGQGQLGCNALNTYLPRREEASG